MSASILIADDDTILGAILKSLLEDRGHRVIVATDGQAALDVLDADTFDLAVFDYHLPELDGLSSARLIHQRAGSKDMRLIAVTADPDGLESRSGARGLFDAIVQKPINLQAFLRVVDSCLQRLAEDGRSDAILRFWRGHGLERRLRARIIPEPDRAFHSFLNFDEPENLDVVLFADAAAAETAARLRTRGNLFTIPFVDVTGRFGEHADAGLDARDMTSWADLANAAKAFAGRRMKLAPRFLHASTIEEQVLAYVYVCGRDLRMVPDPTGKRRFTYNGFFSPDDIVAAVERLAGCGLLRRMEPKGAAGPGGYSLTDDALTELTLALPLTTELQVAI